MLPGLHLQRDDVPFRGQEILQPCVPRRDEDPGRHLRKLFGVGKFFPRSGVAPYDLLGGVALQLLKELDGDVGSDKNAFTLRADESCEAEGRLVLTPDE